MTVGFLSVLTHPREASIARCCVNGVDVTNICYAANDIEGWADCFVQNSNGRYVLLPDRKGIAWQRLTGDVVIDFPRGLD